MNPKYCCEVEPDNVPDLVAVIRCKDCAKKDDPYICKLDGYIQEFGGHRTEEYDDWFCADGERRDDHGPDDQHG